MPKIEQILPLAGPMIDTIDRDMIGSDNGIVRKRVNMRPDATGTKMANTPLLGTVDRGIEMPSGINITLGWCNDNENEAIIYFVWNSNLDHSILRYFTISKTTQKVFYKEPTLGFTNGTDIAAEVVDGRLYWNDNTDNPKSFNIIKAVNYTNALSGIKYGSDDKPFDEKIFPFIKRPPRFAPIVSYESLTEFDGKPIDFNNLRKKQWQVKYCYVYEDFQESAYSPTSKVALSDNEVSATGQWADEITFNNALKIIVDTGSYNVKQVKVAIRDASNRNTDTFYLFRKIEKFKDDSEIIASDSSYDVFFLNNSLLTSIDTARENAYYHNVPLTAKDMLLIDAKYLAMSMPKTGYDLNNEDVDYSLDYIESDTDFSVSSIPMASDYDRDGSDLWNECGRRAFGRTRIRVVVPDKFYPNSTYRVIFKTPDIPDDSDFVKQSEVVASWTSPAVKPSNYPKVAQESLISELNAAIDKCYSIPIKVRKDGDNRVRFDFYYGGLWVNVDHNDDIFEWADLWKDAFKNYQDYIYGDIVYAQSAPVYNGLKRGQYHPFGIVYNDEFGRYNSVFGDKDLYIPPIDESVDASSTSKVYTPKITINSTPPIWANTYRIAYIPYSSYTYTQMVPGVEMIDGDDPDNGVEPGYKFLKINQAILTIITDFPDSLISAYEWMKGDRIRQVGSPDSYEILNEFTRTYTSGEQTITETGYLVKADFVTTAPSSQIALVEIYRPNLTPQNKIFYEIGEEFEILNAGTESRYHAGNFQNQTSLLPAICQLGFGDIYYRTRFSSGAIAGYALVEDNNFSDYYISSGINIGRGVVRTDLKQITAKRVIKTENYIEDTELNRLNIILPGDEYYPVSETYGEITKIIERGDTIKIYQNHRETSVYIGKNYAKDAGGGDIALSTDKVFGSPNPYEEFLGSEYRRSIIHGGKYVYFLDLMTSDFCRSASNGTMSVSKKYGMNKFFEEKCEEFRNYSGTKDIISAYEPTYEIVYVSFVMGNSISTVSFSEDEENKGFLFFVEFKNGTMIPDNFAWYGDFMYSFVNGRIYEHGAGNPNEFYGSARKSSSVEVIANQYPQIRKTFEYMSLDSNGDWSSEMEIEADDNYSFGQKTMILPKMFKSREGVKASAIPRNIRNSVGAEDFQKLYSGNKMSGNSMKITINSSNFGILREVKITSINQE